MVDFIPLLAALNRLLNKEAETDHSLRGCQHTVWLGRLQTRVALQLYLIRSIKIITWMWGNSSAHKKSTSTIGFGKAIW